MTPHRSTTTVRGASGGGGDAEFRRVQPREQRGDGRGAQTDVDEPRPGHVALGERLGEVAQVRVPHDRQRDLAWGPPHRLRQRHRGVALEVPEFRSLARRDHRVRVGGRVRHGCRDRGPETIGQCLNGVERIGSVRASVRHGVGW
ncbi:MAG: hypothetical protein M5U20_00850 [Phycisphaerales bacterium]|nr:hypothetical protein [Phycisphaerales bacterium]